MKETQDYAHEFSDEALITEIAVLDELIDIVDCFGTRDLVMREALEHEADVRGLDLPARKVEELELAI